MKTSQLPKINKDILNINLITKYKKQLVNKEIKKIRNNLFKIAKIDLVELNQFKIKVLIDTEGEKNKKDFVTIAPICFKHYFGDLEKFKTTFPEKKEENDITPSNDIYTAKRLESSDISADEEENILKSNV